MEDALSKLVPMDADINTIVDDKEILLTAWDLNNRSPRFFTKWSYENLANEKQDSKMALGKMTLASATTPYYFKPATIQPVSCAECKPNLYISGDNVAMSPAMFAVLHANEKLGKNLADIRVVSVGAINEEPERIKEQTSLLEWALRLTSLNAPVKKHTQDYMLRYFLRKGEKANELYKFEIDKSREFELDFYR